METTSVENPRGGSCQSQEAANCQLDDSHFQLPIRSSKNMLDADVSEEHDEEHDEEALDADISDHDSTASWEKVNITFGDQVLIDLAHQREDLPCKRVAEIPMVDYDLFYEHIIAGDLAAVQAELEIGANIERENDHNISPLVLSIIHLQFDAIRLFLEKDAEVDHLVDRLPPIVHAVEKGQHAPRIMKLLMEYGADPRVVSGRDGLNALHWAIVFGMVDAVNFLADAGLDLNSTCSEGRTPLTLAAERGHITIVKLLLVKGAELAKQSHNGGTALTWAASYGHLETVKYLLEEGLSINHADNAGLTALGVAGNAGHLKTVEFLIAEGADVDTLSIDPKNITPVSAAACAGHAEVVKALLRSGADLQLPDDAGIKTLDAVMTAGHIETVKVLLEHLGGPDYPKDSVALQIAMADSRNTAVSLMAAVSLMFPHIQPQSLPTENEDLAWIDWVLLLGRELVAPKAMSIMMHVALSNGRYGVVEELLRLGADANKLLPGRHSQSPLALAIKTGCPRSVSRLLKYGADPAGRVSEDADSHETALQLAVRLWETDVKNPSKVLMINTLLESGRCKINQGNSARHTAFSVVLRQFEKSNEPIVKHIAEQMLKFVPHIDKERTSNGSTLMHVAVNRNCQDMVEILLNEGAEIDAEDNQGQTPFLRNCGSPKTMISFLVERGADPFAKDEIGQSGLHIAAINGRTETLQYLLDIGLNIEATTSTGYTPLISALTANQEDTVLWLLDHGASTSVTTFNGKRTILHHAALRNMHRVVTKLLSISTSSINLREDHGQTPLSLACEKSFPDLLSILLSHGADPEAPDDAGDAPLHIALGSSNEDAALFLINHGVDISARGMGGCTALHLAAEYNNIRATRVLLDRGADVDAVDEYGSTPLCVVNYAYTAEMLIKAGGNIEHKDKNGWTPLHHAVWYGNIDAFDVLLRAGASMDVKAGDDGLSVWERVRKVGWRDGAEMQGFLEMVRGLKEEKRWADLRKRQEVMREGERRCTLGG